MKKQKIQFAIFMLLLAVTACDNADYSKSAPFDNGVYLSVAESKTSETMTFNKTIIQREKSFTARLAYPAGTDVTVNVTVDPSQVEAYNSRNNTSYDILPAKHYRLESNEMTIRAGKINSAPLHIYFENLTELEIDKAYLCPVSLNSAQGVGLLDGSTTYWYIVKRSSAITTAVDLRYCYVEVPGFYVPKWGTEPAGNAAHLNNLKAVTFEIITRISNFDEANTDISSLMGIEQYFCFRAGDAGFPRQQLQIQTPAGKFPEANKAKLLKENEWYHLALTYDIATKTIIFYVNGKEQSRSTNYGNSEFSEIKLANRKQESFPGASDGDWLFYIGRSYNDRWLIDRQLNGNVCEARIWDVARTQQEIWKNIVQTNGKFGTRKNTKDEPRFELVSVVKKEFKNPSLDMVETDEEAVVKDLKPTKNGQTYTIRRGTKYVIPIIDKKVNLTITAGPERDTSFEVEEGSDFRIPGDAKQIYTLKTVDNATQTVTIANKTTGEQTTLSKKK